MMRCRHKSLIDELMKMINEDLKKWTDLLSLILWADQTTIHRSTDKTLYELLYECSCFTYWSADTDMKHDCMTEHQNLIWSSDHLCTAAAVPQHWSRRSSLTSLTYVTARQRIYEWVSKCKRIETIRSEILCCFTIAGIKMTTQQSESWNLMIRFLSGCLYKFRKEQL
jgi:hypothetical protein